jgi:S-disulfanyl-L-cysteine oxidoreductase SoxD
MIRPAAALVVSVSVLTQACGGGGGPGSEGRPSGSPATGRPIAAAEHARAASEALPPRFGFGRAATDAEVKAWDIDVMPDGTGLPPGRGTVAEGAVIYAAQCAVCHGPAGAGAESDILVGREPSQGFPFGKDPTLLDKRTIGNYWPYATTLYDYIYRAMPQAVPGSLTPDEVYSLVAYLLFLNHIVPENAVMTAQTLPRVEMPARHRFVEDNRRGGPEIR